jgi:hypothetical protein
MPSRPHSLPSGSPQFAGALVEKVTAAQHFVPPTARELRAQAVQRLQVGLGGLAAMLLLVGLANIIMQHARQSDTTAAKPASSAAGNTDPLADIGVVPSPEAGASAHHPASGAPGR